MRMRTDLWTATTQHRAETRYIVIHHAAARYPQGRAISSIYNFHRSKWPDYGAAGYHVILQEEQDGSISVNLVNCPYIIGAGVARRNHETFHICLASDFTNDIPDQRWIDATNDALQFAFSLFPSAELVGHRDIALPGFATACPGNKWAEWRQLLYQPRTNQRSTPPPAEQPIKQSAEQSQLTPVFPAIDEDTQIVGGAIDVSSATILALARKIAQRTTAYTLTDLVTIITGYVSVCREVDMNVGIPLAQMLHETGWLTSFWSQRPQRNPAGIGVTGEWRAERPSNTSGWAYNPTRQRWERGISFSSWVSASIPAHIGRLLAYALRDGEATTRQKELIGIAISYRPLPDRLRGSCKTLRDLNGTWAVPGKTYASRIVATYRALVGDL